MSGLFLGKVVLVLLFIPATFGVLWAARYWLPVGHRFRKCLERHGVEKVALYSLVATYALGGAWLTVAFS